MGGVPAETSAAHSSIRHPRERGDLVVDAPEGDSRFRGNDVHEENPHPHGPRPGAEATPAIRCSAATRLAVLGCVENRLSTAWAWSGLMMNIWAVAGFRSAAT